MQRTTESKVTIIHNFKTISCCTVKLQVYVILYKQKLFDAGLVQSSPVPVFPQPAPPATNPGTHTKIFAKNSFTFAHP